MLRYKLVLVKMILWMNPINSYALVSDVCVLCYSFVVFNSCGFFHSLSFLLWGRYVMAFRHNIPECHFHDCQNDHLWQNDVWTEWLRVIGLSQSSPGSDGANGRSWKTVTHSEFVLDESCLVITVLLTSSFPWHCLSSVCLVFLDLFVFWLVSFMPVSPFVFSFCVDLILDRRFPHRGSSLLVSCLLSSIDDKIVGHLLLFHISIFLS